MQGKALICSCQNPPVYASTGAKRMRIWGSSWRTASQWYSPSSADRSFSPVAGGAKIFSVISASPCRGLFEERRHQIYGLGLGGFIEPLAVQFQHQIAFLGKGHLAERGVLLEVQRNRQALGILRVAPAQCHRQLYFALLPCDLGLEPVTLDDLFIGVQHRLCDAHIGIVGVFDLQTQSATVTELIKCESAEPVRLFRLQLIAEFLLPCLPVHKVRSHRRRR